jgi:MoaD family protein
MNVKLKIFGLPTLSQITGNKELNVNFEGKTINDLINYLVTTYGRVAADELLHKNGELKLSIRALLNGKDWIHQDNLNTFLKDGDSIALMLSVTGG